MKRILTAVALLAVLLPVLFLGDPAAFDGLVLILIVAAVWEWLRMNGLSHGASVFAALLSGVLGVCLLYFKLLDQAFPQVWFLTLLFWVFGAVYLLIHGVPVWTKIPKLMRFVSGIVAILFTWLALVQLRAIGINMLLSVMLLVWAADVFAYIFGKWLGGRIFGSKKLAVTISPGKTWEGALGGLIGVALVAVVWFYLDIYASKHFDGSGFYTLIFDRVQWFAPLVFIFCTVMAIVGDLVESLVKRSVGFKDSSGLLPGHGGVLDRVDALLPVLPISMFFISVFGTAV